MARLPVFDDFSEVDLYLVSRRHKPATLITLSAGPAAPTGRQGILNRAPEATLLARLGWTRPLPPHVTHHHYTLPDRDVQRAQAYLQRLGLPYQSSQGLGGVCTLTNAAHLEATSSEVYRFAVGATAADLEHVLNARNSDEAGRAFGYPAEAVAAFAPDGGLRVTHHYQRALKHAGERRLAMPSWCAYMRWVPDQFDLIHNIIAPSSRLLAQRYQTIIRTAHPGLAARAEATCHARYDALYPARTAENLRPA